MPTSSGISGVPGTSFGVQNANRERHFDATATPVVSGITVSNSTSSLTPFGGVTSGEQTKSLRLSVRNGASSTSADGVKFGFGTSNLSGTGGNAGNNYNSFNVLLVGQSITIPIRDITELIKVTRLGSNDVVLDFAFLNYQSKV